VRELGWGRGDRAVKLLCPVLGGIAMCRQMMKGGDNILERLYKKYKRISGGGRQKSLEVEKGEGRLKSVFNFK
jgi:hypothetical protein